MRFCFLIAISTVTITAFGEPPSGNHCHSIKQPITWSSIFQGIDLADIEIDGDAPCQGKAMRIELAQRGIEFVVTPDDGDQPGETTVVKVITFAEQLPGQRHFVFFHSLWTVPDGSGIHRRWRIRNRVAGWKNR